MAEFDYIVVGGGSAGCVIASRLTERADLSVALIEAGRRDDDPWIHIPATFFKVIEKGRDIRVYESEPDPALNGRKALVPQGYVLGGGSSVNAMIYIRGNARDYDHWAQLGNRAWSYEKVLPVFRDLENNSQFEAPFHGRNGPLRVSTRSFRHPLSKAFVAAGVEAGLPANDDFNGADQLGVGFYQSTTGDGQRYSAAKAFLKPALNRPNLSLMTERRCAKLLMEGRRCVGVRLEDGTEIRARREVILSTGALESPRLLLLSGIGPAKDLQGLGIDPVVDRKGVGENYQDHFETPVQAETRGTASLLGQDKGIASVMHMARYMLSRTGLLSSNIVECGGFANVMGGDQPDIQFHVLPLVVGFIDRAPEQVDGITINPCLLRPRSRGHVKLRSADFRDKAVIHSNMLSDLEDIETQLRGIELTLRILQQPALQRIVTRLILPTPAMNNREALVNHMRDTSKTVFHPSGTCKMGSAHDKQAVVDQELRVHGVEGLRVADISIMPQLVSGNTNAPAMMIGERCARFILGSDSA